MAAHDTIEHGRIAPAPPAGSSVVVAAAVAVAIGAGSIAGVVLNASGFPLDDAWIHQVVGRNAAVHGIPGFVPGVPSSGSSSVAWPWIIAINHRLLPSLDPVHYLLAVNLVAYAAVVVVLLRAAIRDRLPTAEAAALVALPAITGNVVWLVASGMEHLAFVAASFLAGYLWTSSDGVEGRSRPVAAGVCCGLALLLRPEAVVFVAVLAAYGLHAGRSRRDLVLFLLPCGLALIALLLGNLWTSRSLLPVTFGGRKWLYFDADAKLPSLRLALDLVWAWWRQIVRFFLGVEPGPSATALIGLVCWIVSVAGVARLVRARASTLLLLLGLAIADLAVYCVMLPHPGHGMRYQAMLLVFVFPLLALGGLELMDRVAAAWRWRGGINGRAKLAVVGVVGLVALHSLVDWARITGQGIRHIEGTHVRMARWLATNLPPGTPVASFDIGAIGYFGNVPVVDLGGLVDPGFVPHLYAGSSARYLKERDVRWVVLPDQNDGGPACDGFGHFLRLCASDTITRHDVVSFYTAPAEHARSFAATSHATRGQILYRFDWR